MKKSLYAGLKTGLTVMMLALMMVLTSCSILFDDSRKIVGKQFAHVFYVNESSPNQNICGQHISFGDDGIFWLIIGYGEKPENWFYWEGDFRIADGRLGLRPKTFYVMDKEFNYDSYTDTLSDESIKRVMDYFCAEYYYDVKTEGSKTYLNLYSDSSKDDYPLDYFDNIFSGFESDD